MSGTIFCVYSTLAISAPSTSAKRCRKEHTKMQVKKESQQNQNRWRIWYRGAVQGDPTVLASTAFENQENTKSESQKVPLGSLNVQQTGTGDPECWLAHPTPQNGETLDPDHHSRVRVLSAWKTRLEQLTGFTQATEKDRGSWSEACRSQCRLQVVSWRNRRCTWCAEFPREQRSATPGTMTAAVQLVASSSLACLRRVQNETFDARIRKFKVGRSSRPSARSRWRTCSLGAGATAQKGSPQQCPMLSWKCTSNIFWSWREMSCVWTVTMSRLHTTLPQRTKSIDSEFQCMYKLGGAVQAIIPEFPSPETAHGTARNL